jgi:hypothetical protein
MFIDASKIHINPENIKEVNRTLVHSGVICLSLNANKDITGSYTSDFTEDKLTGLFALIEDVVTDDGFEQFITAKHGITEMIREYERINK